MATRPSYLADNRIRDIPVDQLEVSWLNVRRRHVLTDVDGLAANMDQYGPLQPILVQQKSPTLFAIIVGQRRYIAARQLRWETIPALILRSDLDDDALMMLSFSENIQRHDLAREDKVRIYTELLQKLHNVRAVADTVGVTEKTVKKWIGYAMVPARIKALVRPGGLTVDQARRIYENITDEDIAFEVARRLAERPSTKQERDRVLQAVMEMSDRSADRILSYADELQYQRDIHFVLTEASAQALEQAADEMDIETDDAARTATEEWLIEKQYLSPGPPS